MRATDVFSLLRSAYAEFQADNAQRLAAALAYFALFSTAPLVIVVVEIAGFIAGSHEEIRGQIFSHISQATTPDAAAAIRTIVDASVSNHTAGIISEIVAWSFFLYGSVKMFAALQDALNTVWDARRAASAGLLATIKDRAVSFAMVFAVAFALLAAMGINAAISFASTLPLPIAGSAWLLHVANVAISLIVITLLVATVFKVLPETSVQWLDVWIGALITAIVLVAAQFALGFYLGKATIGKATIASSYGAFGSLIVFVLWVNISAQIFLFGAEFTQVFSRAHGSRAIARRGNAGAAPKRHPGPRRIPPGLLAPEGKIVDIPVAALRSSPNDSGVATAR